MKFINYAQARRADPLWRDRKRTTVAERLLLTTMALASNQEGWFGFGIRRLVDATGLGERHIYDLFLALQQKGYIARDETRAGAFFVLNVLPDSMVSDNTPPDMIPDSKLTPDSMIPDSMTPDSMIPDSMTPDGYLIAEILLPDSSGGLIPDSNGYAITQQHSPIDPEKTQEKVLRKDSAHALKNSNELLFGDAPADIPDDDPHGLFSPVP